ncbi:MAG: nitrogenase component 1 [Clostridiaceae bacterium]|jgi:nitrogenase molybdenum-iron protein alpha/beta subunit|nr:nitrogenase component 1 [Clostridiaceae bacterium]
MKGLYSQIPTLSPDFSGICSALFELGGNVVIHDAGGCTGTYTGYDEPRWFDAKSRMFTSNLDDVEAVLGTDEILVSKILSADECLNGKFFALMGSPSPMVLGTDYDALCRLIRERTGKPAMSFCTKGTELYDEGISKALLSLAKTFLSKERTDIIPDSVNLLGATPLDMTNQHNVDVICDLLKADGFSIQSVWAMGSSLDDIKRSLRAGCNVALTASALKTARYLKQEYDMPFVVGSFTGIKGASECMRSIRAAISGKRFISDAPPDCSGKRVLIVGEQLIANGIRRSLELDFDIGGVDVATLFSADEGYGREGDHAQVDEEWLKAALNSDQYGMVVCDGLLWELLAENKNREFYELPHVAVSSRIGWTSKICPFGSDFLIALKEKREACR